MNKKENNKKNKENKNVKLFLIVLVIAIIIFCVYAFYLITQINDLDGVTNEKIQEMLSLNCTEKYMPVNIDYDEIIQEYIDKIYEYVEQENYQYAYLNLESMYTEKVDISVEQMKAKLEEIAKGGTNLNSYEKINVDDKICFVCKVGTQDSLITIYEYKAGIYSFAFDGFVN